MKAKRKQKATIIIQDKGGTDVSITCTFSPTVDAQKPVKSPAVNVALEFLKWLGERHKNEIKKAEASLV